MPSAHILECARIEPLRDNLDSEENSLRCRIVLKGSMIPLEDSCKGKPVLATQNVSINNGLQLPCHTVTEITIPMRLRPSQAIR